MAENQDRNISITNNSNNIGTNFASPIVPGRAKDINVSVNQNSSPGFDTSAIDELRAILDQQGSCGSESSSREKMELAIAVIDEVEKNHPPLMKRLGQSLKVGGIKAFEQALNHPVSSFLINSVEEWNRQIPPG